MQIRGQQIEAEVRDAAFVGATVTNSDEWGEDVIVLGFGDSVADAQYFGVTMCDVLELRAALNRIAGSPPRW
jgi:phosphoheptose isomerase